MSPGCHAPEGGQLACQCSEDPVQRVHEKGKQCSVLFFVHYFCCFLKFSYNFWGNLPHVEIVNTLEEKSADWNFYQTPGFRLYRGTKQPLLWIFGERGYY